MEELAWLQNTEFSTWIRESSWAIFAFLIVHTISMGFLVGTGFAMSLRALGVGRRIPQSSFAQLFPLMLYSVAVAICSGVLLVVGYPAKALTNPLFYVKLLLITCAIVMTRSLKETFAKEPYSSQRPRLLAITCIALWAAALTAGKFLAYTNKVLLLY